MKRKKNFTVAKILLILIGCLSCLGTVLISQTLSTYYTSYSFINEFRTPTSEDSNSCSISVYRVGSPPETIVEKDEYPCAFHIKNEGTVEQYIRTAFIFNAPKHSVVENGVLLFFVRAGASIVWDETNGLFNSADYGQDSSYVNTKKWIRKEPWIYLKRALSPGEDIQLSTNFSSNNIRSIDETWNIKLIVEALPADADEDEFQSSWGVSKSELQDLGLDQEETAS